MNATIQEIEGIDDYWGPAFRSVYEGEGHEAFVQQLDERIVQHDKEIEKLCNFHYQPTKRKRQRGHLRNAIESAGVSHESTEYLRSKNAHQLQSSSRKTKSHSTVAKKHHNITDEVASSYDVNKRKKPRLDPKRLGGYSNTFPKAGRTPRSHISGDAHNTQNHDASPRVNDSDDESFCYDGYTDGTPELDNEETWEVNSTKLSCEEYNDIAEYHALVKQKKNTTPMADKESDTTSDLRLYLRNRKPCRNSSAERYPDKNRLTPKPYRDQSYQSFPEQRGDRSHGTSAELPHHNKRDPSDQGITYHHNDGSRRHASSENIADRRSRYDAFDERYERHYGWSRHAPHNQRHHTFNDRHYDKRRYDSAECFQGERKSNERYRVQGQHYSVDRQYRESHSAASDRRDRHFDQRRRNSSERHIYDRGHESTRLQGDETSRNERYFGHRRHDSTERQHEYRQHEYRQHVSSRLQEKENSPSERHFGQRRYDSSERQNGDRRNVSVRLLVCDSRSERHFDQSRHDSPDYENSDRRHASTRFQDKENSPNERRFSQSRHDFTERQSGERRHESTIFQEKENRPNDRYIGQGHHDFAERKNGDECREIASYEVEERISKERQLDKRRHDSTERRNGDGCYANAISCQSKRTSHERQCIESPTGSTSPHIADVEPHFSNKAEYHDSPKTSIGLNTTNDLRCYLRSKTPKVDDNAAFERRYGSVHDSDPDEHHGRSHTSTDLQHNQIIGSATRYHNENPLDACHLTKSCRLSSEHHVAPTSGEPFELHQSQSCALSADFNHSQNRSVSAELSHSQSGALSAELHHTQSRALSADRHLGQNPPLSALSVELQYNQNRNLSAELHYRQGRDLCADQHSQNRQSQNRDASTQLCHSQSPLTSGLNHGQSRPLSVELHRSQCRTLSADHHFDDNCYVSAEPYSDERRLTVEHRPNDRLNNFTERQRNGENRPAELQTHTIDPDAKPEPIVVLTSSAECSRNRITDVTTQNAYEYTAECSNPVHADNLNDVRSKLYSHLKTKFTCHREACAAFFCDTSEPRTQSELRDDDCPESAIKSGSSQIYDSVRRQCNTPDPDVKTELNGNTVNDAVDSSAVSGIISTNHNSNQCLVKPVNQADGKCSPLAEKIVKDEPNDNPSDSVTSTLEMDNANHLVSKTSLLHSDNIVKGEPNNNSSELVGSTLEMASANPRFLKSISAEHPSIQVKDFPKPMPLTVYSMRHPNHATRISLRADTVVETAQHNSFITESSGRTKTIDSDATLHNNNLVTFNVRQPSQNSPEANKQSTQESRPNSSISSLPNAKERQFNISVRDVESINLSGIQLVTDTNGNICEEIPSHRDDVSTNMNVDDESRRLNTSSGGTGESNSISADVVLTRDLGLQPRQNCSSVSCEKIQESNVIATPSRDPRLQPTNNCVTTPQNDIEAKVASLPAFFPSNKNQNITAWINSVNEIAIACKWTDEQIVKIAMSKLGGNAKRWFEGFSSNLSWDEWQYKLKAAFPFEENYGKMLSDMLKKTAKTVDSLEDYWIEKMAMLDRCSIRGKKAVECIIFGIEDETVRSKVETEKFNDPEKLLEFLRKQRRCDNMEL